MTAVQKIDLNLLRLFQILYEERSVARAAERLYITRSAVSHALRRLRLMLADELFLRSARGMAPTARAHEVARQLDVLLPQLYDVVNSNEFDPRHSERIFRLSCLPYLTAAMIPELAREFAREAPLARLDVKHLYFNVVDDLDSGALDVAIGSFRRIPPRLVAEEVMRDRYVWVLRKDNPAAGRKLSLQALSQIPQVDLAIGGTVMDAKESYDIRQGLERLVIQNALSETETAFARAKLNRPARFTAPGALAGLDMVAQMDAACLVPEQAAVRKAAALGLAIFDPPYRTPPLVIQMLYHAEFGRRPAVAWLIDRIRESRSTGEFQSA